MRRHRLLVLLVALAAACSGNSSSSVLVTEVIGSAGGQLTVTEGSRAGTSIEVPAGALVADTELQIATDSATAERGTDVVGPATRFLPLGLELLQPAMVTIVFDPAGLPPGTTANDLGVTSRAGSSGALTPVAPVTVDLAAGRVRLAVDRLAVFWVTARTAWTMSRFLVLDDGNRYEFEGDEALDVIASRDEPNFDNRLVYRYQFGRPALARAGIYWAEDAATGGSLFLGQFDAPFGVPAVQEVATPAVAVFDEVVRAGDVRGGSYGYTAYEINLPAEPVPIYEGDGELTATVAREVAVETPAGRFDLCLQVEFAWSFADSRPEADAGVTRVWFAMDVGPVQLQRGDGPLQRLLRATVGGRPVSR